MRRDEALSLTWSNLDLERGTVTLEENKTDDPRAWMLGADVTQALTAWRERYCIDAPATAKVFAHRKQPLDGAHLAAALRTHLQKAGGIRAELFERTPRRAPMRAHDLRATFVTLALATGRTETWVCDRTGHRSSQMLNKYRRAARTAAELGLGWLAPLDQRIPEFASVDAEAPIIASTVEPKPTQIALDVPQPAVGEPRTARDRLVGALTDAVRELLLTGDSAGARVAIRTLMDLAGAEAPSAPEARGSAPSLATRIDFPTSGAGRLGR
jgi:hypothetical protein